MPSYVAIHRLSEKEINKHCNIVVPTLKLYANGADVVTLGEALSHPDYLIPIKGYRRWIVGEDKSDAKPRTLSCNLCGEEFSKPAERNKHYISVHTTVENVETEYHRSVSDDGTCQELDYSSSSDASIMPDPDSSPSEGVESVLLDSQHMFEKSNGIDTRFGEEPYPGYGRNKLIHDIEKNPGPIEP